MSSSSSAPAMPPRSRGCWPAVEASEEPERSAADPSGRGADVVELASGPAADAEFDWDDTAEEPFLWAHTLDPAVDPPSRLPGPTCEAPARDAPGPAVWRRPAGTRRAWRSLLEPARRAGVGALVVLAVAGLATMGALWLAASARATSTFAQPVSDRSQPATGAAETQPAVGYLYRGGER